MIRTDVRVIAATNRNLSAMIAAEKFRLDLFYRLNVYSLKLPPLRERDGDLPLLTTHFLKRFCRELGKNVRNLAPETLQILERHSWPGNVRELQSVLKQAILQATGPVIVPEFLPNEFRNLPPLAGGIPAAGDAEYPGFARFIQDRLANGSTELYSECQSILERLLFSLVLERAANNLTQAARILGISRVTLRNKLAGLGMEIERTSSLSDDSPEINEL